MFPPSAGPFIFPVKSPVRFPVTFPIKSPVDVILTALIFPAAENVSALTVLPVAVIFSVEVIPALVIVPATLSDSKVPTVVINDCVACLICPSTSPINLYPALIVTFFVNVFSPWIDWSTSLLRTALSTF